MKGKDRQPAPIAEDDNVNTAVKKGLCRTRLNELIQFSKDGSWNDRTPALLLEHGVLEVVLQPSSSESKLNDGALVEQLSENRVHRAASRVGSKLNCESSTSFGRPYPATHSWLRVSELAVRDMAR